MDHREVGILFRWLTCGLLVRVWPVAVVLPEIDGIDPDFFFDDDGRVYIASTGIIAGNHNDAFNLKEHLQTAFKQMKQIGLEITGAYFNADSAFDTKDARKTCFNHGLIPNIAENKRNRKKPKRGPKRFFNEAVYKNRFVAERSFAWLDKFKRLLIRFEQKDAYFLAAQQDTAFHGVEVLHAATYARGAAPNNLRLHENRIPFHFLDNKSRATSQFPSLDDVYLQATGRTLMDAELAIAGQRDVKQEKRQSMR